ncbi:MAG: acyl-CoA dehydrogenase family protein [Gemmatimonadota bacterium]|nr:acyl-CoA dehydrogenase family protein [Gemmatimonadota bacterium]
MQTALSWPEDRPELIPFIPFVIDALSDGILTSAEHEILLEAVDGLAWLGGDGPDVIGAWLDPAAPPAPTDIKGLVARVRGTDLVDAEAATRSLTDLGLALWGATGEPGPWSDQEAEHALRALEISLGCLGGESARAILGHAQVTIEATGGTSAEAAAFDGTRLHAYLDRDHFELRGRVAALLAEPGLRIPLGLPTPEYRERVLAAVRLVADQEWGGLGFPEKYGGGGDPAGGVAVFESLAYGDLSVVVKHGVQFGLFGGSVLQLGTQRHHEELLGAIATLELPGCYAMTELGHGSNVRALETTATYDPDSDELVVHTPHEGAAKQWIGNAALHGRLATVFARVIVADEDHGVHAVLVPLRDEQMNVRPGIRIEDCGEKEGLNGVDNGRISFDQVRVPRLSLLDRFASIDEHGRYHSPIPSSGRRFFGMLRTLVLGRVSIASASVSATKVGLTVAIRYAAERRQFGPDNAPEQSILDYILIQRALMPRLATTFALHFAVRDLQAWASDPERANDAELEVAAAGLKAYASEHCVAALQACREACGGQGYLAEARFASLKADTDVFTTFEGANFVLYQLVAKGLLSRFRDEMGDLNLRRALRYLADRAETALTELNPVTRRRTDEEHLLDPEFQMAALRYREERLLRSAATRIRARLEAGMDSFRAVTECQDHLVALAKAHVERTLAERMDDAVTRAPTPGLSEALRSLGGLYALSRIEADRGWFLESGYFEGNKARAIRAQVNALCGEVREYAEILVDGFGIPDIVLPDFVH